MPFCLGRIGVAGLASRHRSRRNRCRLRRGCASGFAAPLADHGFQVAYTAFEVAVAPDQRRVRIGRAANSSNRAHSASSCRTRSLCAAHQRLVGFRLQRFQLALGAAQFITHALEFHILLGLSLTRIRIAHRLTTLGRIQAFNLFLGLFEFGLGNIALDHCAPHFSNQHHAANGPTQQQTEYGNPCQRRPHMCQ